MGGAECSVVLCGGCDKAEGRVSPLVKRKGQAQGLHLPARVALHVLDSSQAQNLAFGERV